MFSLIYLLSLPVLFNYITKLTKFIESSQVIDSSFGFFLLF